MNIKKPENFFEYQRLKIYSQKKAKRPSVSQRKLSNPHTHLINFDIYIQKLSHEVNPSLKIKRDTKSQINTFINLLGQKIVEKSNILIMNNNLKTIDSKTIQAATKLVIKGELLKYAVSEGVKAVGKYNSFPKGPRLAKLPFSYQTLERAPNLSKSQQAEITLSVSRAEELIRDYAQGKNTRVSEDSPVYLAAVLDYVISELVALSGENAKNSNVVMILPKHLLKAINDDEDLALLMNSVDFAIIGGGVGTNRRKFSFGARSRSTHTEILRDNLSGIKDPVLVRLMRRAGIETQRSLTFEDSREILKTWLENFLNDVIIFTKYSKRTTVIPEDVWASMKTKMYSVDPNPVSNKDKSTKLLIPKLPLQRLVREISQGFKTDLRFSESAMNLIQSAAEHYMVDLYMKAERVTAHTGRKRLSQTDLQFALKY